MSIFSLKVTKWRKTKLQVQGPLKKGSSSSKFGKISSPFEKGCLYFSSVNLSAGFVLKDVSPFWAVFFLPLFFPVVNGRTLFLPKYLPQAGLWLPKFGPVKSAALSDLKHLWPLSLPQAIQNKHSEIQNWRCSPSLLPIQCGNRNWLWSTSSKDGVEPFSFPASICKSSWCFLGSQLSVASATQMEGLFFFSSELADSEIPP